MLLGAQSHHEMQLKVAHVMPVGTVSQGRTLDYGCQGCDETVSMLDDTRRGWFIYSVVVGLGLVVAGLWIGGGAVLLALLGAGLAVSFGALVIGDALKRRRHPALD